MTDFIGYVYFESWGLLARALEQFNESQKIAKKKQICLDPYIKIGKRINRKKWILHNLEDPDLQMQWENFISNPDNRVLFTKEQLYGEEYL